MLKKYVVVGVSRLPLPEGLEIEITDKAIAYHAQHSIRSREEYEDDEKFNYSVFSSIGIESSVRPHFKFSAYSHSNNRHVFSYRGQIDFRDVAIGYIVTNIFNNLDKAELFFEKQVYNPNYLVSIINPIGEFAAKQAAIKVLDTFDKKVRNLNGQILKSNLKDYGVNFLSNHILPNTFPGE